MRKYPMDAKLIVLFFMALCWQSLAFSDAKFDELISAKKYREALDYADDKISPADRNADVWVKMALANEALGMTEKALACYLVSWRMNPGDYRSLLGAAKVYNQLGQPENAMNMAKKALDQDFTAEASWEYARACIALDKASEAKKALEKVIQSDPANSIANRELGNIYFDEKAYSKAVPLLEKALKKNPSGELAYKLGKSYLETNKAESALKFLNVAVEKKAHVDEARLDLGRTYYALENYKGAVDVLDKAKEETLDAHDMYILGVSKEKTGDQKGAFNAYLAAIKKFGTGTKKEALLAREKAGRYYMEQKNYAAALSQFEFIVSADSKAAVIEDIYFLLADVYQGMENSPKAITTLEKAIQIDEKNVEAYARLADLYAKNGMNDKAKETYETLIKLNPGDPGVYLALGEYQIKAKKYSEALKYFEKSNSLNRSAEASEGITVAAYRLGEFDKAKEAAKATLMLDAKSWDARIILAKVMLKEKDYKTAKAHFEFIVKKMPKLEFWEDLAVCYEKTDDPVKLALADKKITELDPENVESRQRLARYADKKNDFETAYRMYNDLAKLTPNDANVFRRLYEIANQKGQNSAVIAYMKQYLKLKPDDAEAHRDLGDALYEKKDYDGALEEYRAAIKIKPSIKGFYKRYAEIVIAKGQAQEVIKALTGVIKAGEADFGTFTTLGMMYQKQKVYDKAIEMYHRALQLEPQNTDALTALASSQAANGDVDAAIITYEQVVMMNPKATDEYRELGILYEKQNRSDEASKAFKHYLTNAPQDYEIAEKVGEFAFKSKAYDEATKYLEMVKGERTEELDYLLMLGEAMFKAEKYGDAIGVLIKLKTKNLKRSVMEDVLRMLAVSYEKDGRELLAARTYGEYEQTPGVNNPDAAYKHAFLQEKANQSEAEKIYEQNTKSYPRDFRNFLRLGLIYSENKETLPKAIPLLKRTTGLADSIPKVWLELARVYGKLGKTNDELHAYQQYIKTDPQNLEANKRIGMIMIQKGKLNEGMINLEIANTMSSDDPEVMSTLAMGYMKTGRSSEALDLLKKAKALKKDDPEIRFNLYELYNKLGMPEKALEEIESLVKIKRDNDVLLIYGKALYKQNKLKKAMSAIEDILATNPENIDALMLKADIQRAKKEYGNAIETYKEISYIDAQHVPSLCERANVYLKMSKVKWAETFYKRALQINPQYALAELGLAKLAKLQKKSSLYRQHLEKARKLDPDNELVLEELKQAGL